jgi:magnesium-transporting ATPase (P-type)
VASLEDLESLKPGVRYTHVQTLHFDSDVKRMTVVYHDLHTRKNLAFMKGAPERVLDACQKDGENTLSHNSVVEVTNRFASEGLVDSRFVLANEEESSCRCFQGR